MAKSQTTKQTRYVDMGTERWNRVTVRLASCSHEDDDYNNTTSFIYYEQYRDSVNELKQISLRV